MQTIHVSTKEPRAQVQWHSTAGKMLLKDPLCLMLVLWSFCSWFQLVWLYCQMCNRNFHTLPFTQKIIRNKCPLHTYIQSKVQQPMKSQILPDTTGNTLLFPSLVNARSTWLNLSQTFIGKSQRNFPLARTRSVWWPTAVWLGRFIRSRCGRTKHIWKKSNFSTDRSYIWSISFHALKDSPC